MIDKQLGVWLNEMTRIQKKTVMLASMSLGKIADDELWAAVRHAHRLFRDSMIWALVEKGWVGIRVGESGEPIYHLTEKGKAVGLK